jgi:hypothetical protein
MYSRAKFYGNIMNSTLQVILHPQESDSQTLTKVGSNIDDVLSAHENKGIMRCEVERNAADDCEERYTCRRRNR